VLLKRAFVEQLLGQALPQGDLTTLMKVANTRTTTELAEMLIGGEASQIRRLYKQLSQSQYAGLFGTLRIIRTM